MGKDKNKSKVRRPKPINPLPRADLYAEANERIAVFEGGVISTRWVEDAAGAEILHVTLYGLADNVAVTVAHPGTHTIVTTPVTGAPWGDA